MMPVHLRAAAARDLAEAAEWYERQTMGMGEKFLRQVQSAAEFISEFPESGEELPKGFRRKLLRQFPYALIYTIEPDELAVFVVADLRRRLGYWLRRDR
jgi:toxin ParE1/3/4